LNKVPAAACGDYEAIPGGEGRILRRAVAKVYFQTRIDAKALNKVPAAACGDYEEIPGGEGRILRRAVAKAKQSPAEIIENQI